MAKMTKAQIWAKVKELAQKIWEQNPEKIRKSLSGPEDFIDLGYHGAYKTYIMKNAQGDIDYVTQYAEPKERLSLSVASQALSLMEKCATEGFQKEWDAHLRDCPVCSKKAN